MPFVLIHSINVNAVRNVNTVSSVSILMSDPLYHCLSNNTDHPPTHPAVPPPRPPTATHSHTHAPCLVPRSPHPHWSRHRRHWVPCLCYCLRRHHRRHRPHCRHRRHRRHRRHVALEKVMRVRKLVFFYGFQNMHEIRCPVRVRWRSSCIASCCSTFAWPLDNILDPNNPDALCLKGEILMACGLRSYRDLFTSRSALTYSFTMFTTASHMNNALALFLRGSWLLPCETLHKSPQQ